KSGALPTELTTQCKPAILTASKIHVKLQPSFRKSTMTSTHHPKPLTLHILSDLHLGVQGMPLPQVRADITILAGDIARAEAAMRWASQFDRPVLYVAGNHEFYGGSIPAVREDLARCAK